MPRATTLHHENELGTELREKLEADRTYYVRTDGSDSNTGLADSAGGAFLTIQKAVNVVSALDTNGKTVTIQVRSGTYTGAVVLRNIPGAITDSIIIKGDSTTPSNVIVSTTSATCFFGENINHNYVIDGFKLQTTTSGSCIYSTNSSIRLKNIDFGACAQFHIASLGGKITISSNYTITGGAAYHYVASSLGQIYIIGKTITLTGTPAFTYFALAEQVSQLTSVSNTYSGSATGSRYYSSENSSIQTNGGGANYFPGDVVGSTATGGLYA